MRTLVLVLAMLSVTACVMRRKPASEPKFIYPMEMVGQKEYPELKLSRLDALKVPYRVVLEEGTYPSAYNVGPELRHFVRVLLGKLTEEQFNTLKQTYSNGKSQVVFKPERSDYELTDFLVPGIQAIDRSRNLRESDVAGDVYSKNKSMENNCWMTAYEITRADPKVFKTWDGPATGEQIFTLIKDEKYSERVANTKDEENYGAVFQKEFSKLIMSNPSLIDGEGQELVRKIVGRLKEGGKLPAFPNYSKNPALKTGDILLVGDEEAPEHAAIYVDTDLYFERTQIGDLVGGGNRLVLWNDIVATYGEIPRYSHWRVKTALPAPESVFTEKVDGEMKPVATTEHPIAFDGNGRAFIKFR